MGKLTPGEKLQDFTYDTAFAEDCRISEAVNKAAGRTALVFLRYYGCTLCQLDMRRFAKEYEKIHAAGGQMLVVLQSATEKLKPQLTEHPFPYDIICDPAGALYEAFGIECAPSMKKLADAKTVLKMGKAVFAGLKHGDYEGKELQLPAVFVVDHELTLSYVHYGKSAGDVPEPETLAKLL